MGVRYTIPFKDYDDQQWRIDIEDNISASGDPIFNYSVVQATFPVVEATLLLTDTITHENVIGSDVPTVGSLTVVQGHTYQIRAGLVGASTALNPRLRLTIYENKILIFDKSIVATDSTVQILKTGIAIPGYIYDIIVTGDSNIVQVTPVDNESNTAGIPVPVRGNGEAGVIAWTPDNTDDPFACFKSSTLTINCIQEGQINVDELQNAYDKDFLVIVYRNEILYWQGFLVPDGISYPLLSNPNSLTLQAICGLTMLSNLSYKHIDLQGTTNSLTRCPMNYVRAILFSNLGNILPIRWVNYLQCTAFPLEDVFTGSVQWSANGEGFLSYESQSQAGVGTGNTDDAGSLKSCEYILKGILQSMQCSIYLADGRWNIVRIPDLVRPNIPYKQINGTLGVMNIQTGTIKMLNTIGRTGFNFVNEDAKMTSKQGSKSCTVTYEANIRDNILPNGNQDLEGPGGLLYWNIFDITNPFTILGQSLDGRDGSCSVVIGKNEFDPGVTWFTMFQSGDTILGKNGLPIDSKTMIKYINFGFQFELFAGFANTGGVINWAGDPFRIKVILNMGSIQYFLNKFGFWVTVDTYIPIVVDNLQINDVAQINFNTFQNIIIPVPDGPVVAGYQSDIQVLFRADTGQHYYLDNIYVNISKGNDVYSSTYPSSKNTTADKRTIAISSSFSGYMLSNFMTSPFNSDVECAFADADIYTGSLTALTANAIMRCMYKSMRIFNGSINTTGRSWTFDNLYNIQPFGSSFFLPLNASYNIEKCQVNNLVAIEIRNDFVALTEKYYNSNDNQLSN